jgi:SEC-C motif-containing protein
MRSRYSAFALGEAEYLLHTLHKDHEDRGVPRAELLRALRASKDRRRYTSLRILDERRSGRTAEVLFCAGVTEAGKDVSFVELSDFEHDGTGWRYLSGILLPLAYLKRDVDGLGIDEFLVASG